MNSVDKATTTMIENLYKNTGKTLEQWIEIVNQNQFSKHGEIVSFLKTEYGLGHGFANLVTHRSLGSDAASAASVDQLIDKQYKGKEHFQPLYNYLLAEILMFGSDIEIVPKNAFVSLRRKRQFAMLQPATKTRFEIGINLKGQEPQGVLETVPAGNLMCTHRINITSQQEVTDEVLKWIRLAYDKSI